MASKAKFGRLPRAAPSLTSTLVSLAAQYQQVRESNIVDAWKNGGQFEGKPVHDKDVLKWFTDRRNELSQGDPKWDYYDNQVREYTFSIANSKQELAYKQHKQSDMQMVAFYDKWAKQLPPDSEAYRQRESLSAQYRDRANAGSAARGRAAADKAYAAHINADYAKGYAYTTTMTFLEREAHNQGILIGNETLDNVDPNTSDGHAIQQLWDDIAHSPDYAKDRAFYTQQVKLHGDPHFNGDFSQNAANGYARVATAATADQITAATKAGRKGDIKTFTAAKDKIRGTQILTGGFDETAAYEDAHAAWLKVFTSTMSTPTEIDNANQKYIGELTKIRGQLQAQLHPGEVDNRLGALANELKTMGGDESPNQHWSGMFGAGPSGTSTQGESGVDAVVTAQSVNANRDNLKNLQLRDANGNPMFVLSKIDKGKGVPTATQPLNNDQIPWATIPIGAVDPQSVYVIQNDPGDPRSGNIVTAVKPTPIIAAGVAPDTKGVMQPTKSSGPVGWQFTMPDGKTGYRYIDAAGNTLLTPDNPFGSVPDFSDTSVGGSINVNGAPTGAIAIDPHYFNPASNSAASARITKSGYGLALILSNPKDDSVYTEDPAKIIGTMRLEAGNDPARLAAMITDADQHRATYLGTSTDEQNRIRNNYYKGIPNPVPLPTYAGMKGPQGIGTETGAISDLTMQAGSQAGMEGHRGDVAAGLQPSATTPDVNPYTGFVINQRKVNTPTSPVNPLNAPQGVPTSLGNAFPANIATALGGAIQTALGGALPRPSLPGGLAAPGTFGGLTAPAPTTPAPAPTAPKATAPLPVVAPISGVPVATHAPTAPPPGVNAPDWNRYGGGGPGGSGV